MCTNGRDLYCANVLIPMGNRIIIITQFTCRSPTQCMILIKIRRSRFLSQITAEAQSRPFLCLRGTHTHSRVSAGPSTRRSTEIHTHAITNKKRRPRTMAYTIWTMAWRCVWRIYHLRSRSEEVCSHDKPLASLGVYLGCKLPLTSTSGGIFAIHTSKPWFIYYLYCIVCNVLYVINY